MNIPNLPEPFKPLWELAQPILATGRPGDDIHAAEVVSFVLERNESTPCELDVLVPTAMMHDIGHSALLPEHFVYVSGEKKIKNAKLVHMLAGAKIAHDLLHKVEYDSSTTQEIVEIISMHDADQLKDVEGVLEYYTENKRLFHDIDSLFRYSLKRMKKMQALYPSYTLDQLFDLIREHTHFFDESFYAVADERLTEIRTQLKST